MTFVELLLGAGITSMVLSALMLGSSMLQQQFAASTQYAVSQSDQMRAMDYSEMDLRRAKSVTLAAGATPLTVASPDFYHTVSGKKEPRLPGKAGRKIQYNPSASTVTVSYTLQGTNLIRTEGGVARTTRGRQRHLQPRPPSTGHRQPRLDHVGRDRDRRGVAGAASQRAAVPQAAAGIGRRSSGADAAAAVA